MQSTGVINNLTDIAEAGRSLSSNATTYSLCFQKKGNKGAVEETVDSIISIV